MKLRCIIVDDEPVARQGLAEDIGAIDFMEVTGIAESALQAMELLTKQSPDILFLDIEMPKLNGFDLLYSLEKPPLVILTTAYSHYAPQSYDAGVIDYLLKPISFDRLLKACNKARDFHKQQITGSGSPEYFFVKSNGRYEKIMVSELLFVEAADNYIFLNTTAKKYLVYRTLKSMEEYLPVQQFVKVHKSFIVAFDKVDSLEGNQLLIGSHSIPVSRNFREALVARMAAR
jgi:two-component system, LytTR family, response regulator